MSRYRAIIHYHFKKGMEEKGMKFFQKEIVEKAQELGCQGAELWQSERDRAYAVGIGAWNSIEDARRFQALWDQKEKEILRYCVGAPKQEFFKTSTVAEPHKRAA